jgi:hypothetical protein
MMGVRQARRLARFRENDRRGAAAEMAETIRSTEDADARVEQITQLINAVAMGPGATEGTALAARGEFVGRLLAGQVIMNRQRERSSGEADEARRRFGLADARADFARRGLAMAERLDRQTAELRAAAKTPVRRKRK